MDLAGLLFFLLCSGALLGGWAVWRCVVLLKQPPRFTLGAAMARQGPLDPREAVGADFAVCSHPQAGEIWRVAGGRSDGPVGVLLHGWAESRFSVLPVLAPLLPGFRAVYVADLPGHGDSPIREFAWGRMRPAHLEQILNQVEEGDRAAGIVLVGRSIGANLAWILARRFPDRVKAAILDSPVRSPGEAAALVREILGLPVPMFQRLLAWHLNRWGRTSGESFWPGQGPESIRPVLVLIGAMDPWCGRLPEAGKIACEIFEEAGHLEAAGREPVRYRQRVEHWLDRLAD